MTPTTHLPLVAAPAAWQHCLVNSDGYEYDGEVTNSENHPFGRPGRDYDASFLVISRPLYAGYEEAAALIEKQGAQIDVLAKALKSIVNDSRGTTRNQLREIADAALLAAKTLGERE